MKRLLGSAIAGAFLAAVISTTAMAGLFDWGRSLEGVIKDVDSSSIVVSFKDNDQIYPTLVSVMTNEKTEFKDVESLTELKEGDTVKITYSEENDMKIAKVITKLDIPQEAQENSSKL